MPKSRESDIIYREYMERREREGRARRRSADQPPSTRRLNIRFGNDNRLHYSTQHESKFYDLRPRKEHSTTAYKLINAQIGEDPLTTVRSMRSRLRRLALDSELRGDKLRSDVAKSADGRLSVVERDLEKVQQKRSEALLNADAEKAEEYSSQMKRLKEQAISSAHADLLLDRKEVNEHFLIFFTNHPKVVKAITLGLSSKFLSDGDIRRGVEVHHTMSKGSMKKLHRRRQRKEKEGKKSRHVLPSQMDSDSSTSKPHSRRRNHVAPPPPYQPMNDERPVKENTGRSATESEPTRPTERIISGGAEREHITADRVPPPTRSRSAGSLASPASTPIHSHKESLADAPTRTGAEKESMIDAPFKRNSRINLNPSEGGMAIRSYSIALRQSSNSDEGLSSASICPFCGGRDPGLLNADYLRKHVAESCPLMAKCEYCDKIVEIDDLNDHRLNRCPFVDNALEECKTCGLARYPIKGPHPGCVGDFPPLGAAWCPLCSKLVKTTASKSAWNHHAVKECLNNPRNSVWPKIGDFEHDRRGEQLLESLNRDRGRTYRPTEVGPSQARGGYHGGGVNAESIRMALRALNRERRAVYLKSRNRAVRPQLQDSDSDEH